ncbi:MAG TPA: hypothetical protein PK280_00095 [Planctomycetota bacterium]|nr:hypothetical protein [Planctomycetota bacterium]
MAAMIGRGKSWLWWLAGFLCAFVFGARAGAAEAVALYGVRPGPGGAEQPEVDPERQKKAGQLLADYLAPVTAVEPADEAKAAIEKLIRNLGSADFEVREQASLEIVRQGPAALGLLREAAKSKDAEVATRAGAAVTAIEMQVKASKLAGIKALGSAGQNVVRAECIKASAAAAGADKAAAEAEAAGKADDAEKARAQAKAARERARNLSALLRSLLPEDRLPPPPPPYGMIRPMPSP